MKTRIRIALASAAIVAGLAVAGSSPAAAQVAFSGSFPLPHGRISIGIGDPFFSVGAVVPYGYSVIQDPTYGYGFYYGNRWIPVQPYGQSWIIVDRPYFPSHVYARPYVSHGYYGSYGSYGYRGYSRGYDGSRSYSSNDRRGGQRNDNNQRGSSRDRNHDRR